MRYVIKALSVASECIPPSFESGSLIYVSWGWAVNDLHVQSPLSSVSASADDPKALFLTNCEVTLFLSSTGKRRESDDCESCVIITVYRSKKGSRKQKFKYRAD